MNALCHTPTNHPCLSPSPRPSPTVIRVLFRGSRLVGEGATRGGAARLATDRIHQPTRGRSGLGRPAIESGEREMNRTWEAVVPRTLGVDRELRPGVGQVRRSC